MNRIGGWRVLLTTLLVLILAGCSSRSFFYNRLPTLAPWYLQRYVNLDRQQEDWLDERVGLLHDWHRREELPQYVSLLAHWEGRLDEPLDAAAIDAFSADIETAWYRLRDRALDELLTLAGTLSEQQIDEFIGELEKRQRKYERKYLKRSEDEYREDAADNLQELLEDYLGRLEAPQREQLASAAAALQRSDRAWLEERARWIASLREALRREPGWEDDIRGRILDWEQRIDPANQALYEHNSAIVEAVVAEILNGRTQRQDQRLRRELGGLREDLCQLAQQDRDSVVAACAAAAPGSDVAA